ncbi:MAG: ABC transporter permease [Aggregatilineales bacterium]
MKIKPTTNDIPSAVPIVNARDFLARLNVFGEAQFAVIFFVLLFVINILLNPARFRPNALGTAFGLSAPLILAAIASTPVILGGQGGIDVSVGPLMGLLNVLVVRYLIGNWGLSSPYLIVPFVIGVGVLSGLINGFLAAGLHLQPIVATLGTYLIYSGLTTAIMPAPGGTIPDWLASLSGATSVIPVIAVLIGWWILKQTPYYEHLMATGGDDRAAYTSGIPITTVRMIAYILTGVGAGIASLSLSALLGSADPTVGPTFTLTAIAAVALGGVSLAGGRGGLIGAMLGAIDIFFLQSILAFFNVSTFALQVAYGVILVLALGLSSTQGHFLLKPNRRAPT